MVNWVEIDWRIRTRHYNELPLTREQARQLAENIARLGLQIAMERGEVCVEYTIPEQVPCGT